MVNANVDISELELVARSKTDINFDKEAAFFLGALATNVKQDYFKKKKKSKPVKPMLSSMPNFLIKYLTISTLLGVKSLSF